MFDQPSTGIATLVDVARAAEVSLATASRVLNGSPRKVREDLRARVMKAAAALNYAPNAQAQAMARGHTNVVGLVVHDIADPYFSSISAGVMRHAEDNGLIVTMASTLRRPEREVEYVAALRAQRAQAVVLAGSRVTDQALQDRLGDELARFQAAGGRVAMISQRRIEVDTITLENHAGARALARALYAGGYRRFGVLGGPEELVTARDRLAGFREGLADHGAELPDELVVHGGFTRDGGYHALRELLSRRDDVDCLFAVNDVMAVGAMAALRDLGRRLPEDMAVAGFDDIATLRDVTPALTTVRVPLEELGAMAVSLVLDPEPAEPRTRRVRGEVVIRASTPKAGPGTDIEA
ncbi:MULTISPECIES: LacI family DNA-binding transcriptional regulator [Actinoalloteichus]|uniref:Transcriptional regulator, LacI family n=1 Tax=Actinoalloteichus fjordicus TaxID=1612552 RepID=A0AAC9PTJ0_9PSEU|nr:MULTISPECIES: LacI family DNA-binding transcriptional regulator [Actinoalloteichus]APU16729.1 transcriptional regulator, LacI family [Actinoalloteichus fjordicus]APU22795.1 transcriptional regulator, LacI family [Actinoalloteichus sp. GBA129-24]